MNNYINLFYDFISDRRIKLNPMSSIIEDGENHYLTDTTYDLLIRSYIVLTYAYWESCFFSFQDCLIQCHENHMIKDLSYNLQNDILLKLGTSNIEHKNRNKRLSEISNIDTLTKIITNIQESISENKTKKVSEIVQNPNIKNTFYVSTNNPSISLISDLLKKYNINLKKIIEINSNDPLNTIPKYFEQEIFFLINERNAIAHKNSDINATDDGTSFMYYSEYIKFFCNENNIEFVNANTFIQNLSFDIDSFFRILIDEVNKKINGDS